MYRWVVSMSASAAMSFSHAESASDVPLSALANFCQLSFAS